MLLSSLNTHSYRHAIQMTIALIIGLNVTPSYALKESLIENPPKSGPFITDSWVVNYKANDFSEKISEATVLYIPKNFGQEAAFFMRCKPFFTNFSMQYTELEKNLSVDGKLPNASDKFAKHGYVYDDKQKLKVQVGDKSQNYTLSVGGQKNHLSNLFKTQQKIQAGELGMSWFYSFTFKEMPSFRPESTPDDAADFFKQLNHAIKQKQDIQFSLESDQNHKRQFQLNTQRMLDFVPENVMEFCITNRQLK
ncbi:MAG: hypothetical protein R3254_09640 [Thiomicrorhabdus sp.]|nr:hypothetical protein [Thiomicrorhabdus sp.]